MTEFADVRKTGQMVNSEDDRGERPISEHWYSRYKSHVSMQPNIVSTAWMVMLKARGLVSGKG